MRMNVRATNGNSSSARSAELATAANGKQKRTPRSQVFFLSQH
jgi:hypothetical protein